MEEDTIQMKGMRVEDHTKGMEEIIVTMVETIITSNIIIESSINLTLYISLLS